MRSIILLFLNIQGTFNFAISVKIDKKKTKKLLRYFLAVQYALILTVLKLLGLLLDLKQ